VLETDQTLLVELKDSIVAFDAARVREAVRKGVDTGIVPPSILSEMAKGGKIGTPEYAELKRRLGWEFNGMRLHELYFENLGGKGALNKAGKLGKKLAEEFGSYENWEADFKGVGTMRGIGWAILYQDPLSGRLINQWINEHDVGHPAGCNPLLVLDVFEHAFMIDYGLKRADYITAFFKNIKWEAVEGRMK